MRWIFSIREDIVQLNVNKADLGWFDQAVLYVKTAGPAFITRVAIGLVIAFAVYVAGKLLASLVVRALRRGPAATLGPVLARAVRTVAIIAAILMGLDQIGINVTTLLAGAGVVGLAVGFGAQTLVKDIISGFFLIAEGAIAQGDLVKIGDVQGTVEEVGMRTTKVRSLDGQLWYIPNGSITTVGNHNREWSCAIVDVGVAYEQDYHKGLEALDQIGKQWAKDNPELVVEPPTVVGIAEFGAHGIVLRLMAKVKPAQHWLVERELRARIKSMFDDKNVEIPFSRIVVYHRKEEGSGITDTTQGEPS